MTDDKGWTALHHSAMNGSYELFRFFLALGIDIFIKTDDGQNCLHVASMNGQTSFCKALINNHKFDKHMADDSKSIAIHYSAVTGNYELFKFFADIGTDISLKNIKGGNSLHLAALNGHLHLCKILIKKYNFDVHMVDNYGWKSLHYSARNGSYELVTFFVDEGTDIYLKTNDGSNCLHIAAENGHLNLCKILIDKYNFDVDLKNNNGYNVLHFSSKNGSFDLFSYILGKGSEIYCKANDMKNVLHLSAHGGHFEICEFVLEYFTKDFKENNNKKQYILNGKSYKSQVFFKYNTIFLHAMDSDGNTYLHLAAEGNQAKACELLLKYDTSVTNLLNKKDETARKIAEDNGHIDVLNVLKAEYEKAGNIFCSFHIMKLEKCYCIRLKHIKHMKHINKFSKVDSCLSTNSC